MTTALLIALIVLQVLDAASTAIGLRSGARENNPVGRWIMDRLGVVPGMIAIKAPVIALLIWAADTPGIVYAFAALSAVYVAVVINNVRVIRR